MTSRPIEPGAILAALTWAAGTWAALGVVALSGSGTATRVGLLPPLWLLAALAIVAAICAAAFRLDARKAAPLWLGAIALLPWIPGPVPVAFLVLAGPLSLLVSVASLAVTAVGVRVWHLPSLSVRRQMLQAGVLAACLYSIAAWRMAPTLPGGDEPHYLVITQSLLGDGDLRIENNHARRDYLAYVDGELKPDYLRRGRDGQIYSIHAPGLPALLVPAFALGGYPGVVALLILVSAAGSTLAWRAGYALTASPQAAWVGWSAVALSVPFFFQAFTVYPDGPAALCVLLVVARLASSGWPTRGALVRTSLAIAVLPWMHSRFAALAAALWLVVLLRVVWPRHEDVPRTPAPGSRVVLNVVALTLLPLLSGVAWLWFFHAIYGVWDPRAPYGPATDMHLARVPVGITGLLLDQQFGLLPNAPIFLIALAGLAALWRTYPRLTIELAAIATPYLLAVAGFHMWWAGRSSPARFLVPVLLVAALPIAAWWHRHQSRTPRMVAAALLAVSFALTAWLAWADHGALVYNVRDGYALWLDRVAPATNLAHALPSLFQSGPLDAWARACGWAVAGFAGWALLRWLERRLSANGVWRAAAIAVGCAATLTGATAGWAASGRPSLEPGASAVAWLNRSCLPAGPVVSFVPFRANARADVPSAPDVPNASRRTPSAQATLWGGHDVPAGRYRVTLQPGLNATGTVAIAIGHPDATIERCEFADTPPGPTSCVVDLPAGAESLWLMPDAALRRSLPVVALRAETFPPPGTCGVHAERGTAGAGGMLFLIDGHAYVEPTGAWVAGASSARFVVVPSAAHAQIRLRNGGATNTVESTLGAWHDSVVLAPGTVHDLYMPRRAGDDSPIWLTVRTTTGFRPSDVDPANHDVRLLGVWVELP